MLSCDRRRFSVAVYGATFSCVKIMVVHMLFIAGWRKGKRHSHPAAPFTMTCFFVVSLPTQ